MNRKYIIVADDSIKGFDEEIAKLEREWGAEEIEPSDDCISREDTLKEFKRVYFDNATVIRCAELILGGMPPVTPTSEDIKESYLKGYDYGVKDWFKSKTQPSEDAVSREAVIEHICENKECYKEDCKGRTLKRCPDLQWVLDLPSVTPERPKGKWLHIYKSDIACECSVCHIQMPITEYFHYCPNCGAEMSGGEEDEDRKSL